MTTIHLIRHGQAAKAGHQGRDPGLDETGWQQARDAAARLAAYGPLPIIVSPLRRARETASAFERAWNREARIDGRVAEIPSPHLAPGERAEWLRTLPQRKWAELDESLLLWRRAAIECVSAISEETVVVSHSMVINALVSWIRDDERVVCCQPLPGSCTTLERSGNSFRLVAAGAEGASQWG